MVLSKGLFGNNMERIFILGTTKYAFMLRKMIEQERKFYVIGHTVSKNQIEEQKRICDKEEVKLFPFEELSCFISDNESVNILNAIGYSNMNDTRKKFFQLCKKRGYNVINYISDKAVVLTENLGEGNIVFPGAYIGTNVDIGNNNVFYAGCVMTHDIRIGDNNFIAANVTCGGEVNIGSNCFLGMGSVIRNRLNISNYSLIGASAYLDFSTKDKAVVVPNKSVLLEKSSLGISLTPRKR